MLLPLISTHHGANQVLLGSLPRHPRPPSCQVRVEEELAFIDGSSIYKRIVATGVTECGRAGGSTGSDEEGLASGKAGQATYAVMY